MVLTDCQQLGFNRWAEFNVREIMRALFPEVPHTGDFTDPPVGKPFTVGIEVFDRTNVDKVDRLFGDLT
jgi:hypothetical protein